MKTKFFAIAAVMFGLMGTSVCFAANDKKAKEEKTTETKERKMHRHADKKCPKEFNPFEGITLSAEQQQKIEALKAQRPCAQKDEKCTNSKDGSCGKDKAEAKKDDGRKAYMNKMKEILTPEQYKVFIDNMKAFRHQKAHNGKMDKGNRKPMNRERVKKEAENE